MVEFETRLIDIGFNFQYDDKMKERISETPLSAISLPSSNAIDQETLSRLDEMDAEGLKAIIRKVSGAMWGVGCLNEEEVYNAMLLRLAHDGLKSRDAKDAIASIREWIDRKHGKPLQSTKNSVTIGYEPLVIKMAE